MLVKSLACMSILCLFRWHLSCVCSCGEMSTVMSRETWKQPCWQEGRLRSSPEGLFVKPPMAAPTTLVGIGRGAALRLALIALLVLTMLVVTLLNVSAVEGSVPSDVPARSAILSTEPAGVGSSGDSIGLSAGQRGNGGSDK